MQASARTARPRRGVRGGRGHLCLECIICVIKVYVRMLLTSTRTVPFLSPLHSYTYLELRQNARRGLASRAVCSRQRPAGWLQAAACNRCYGRHPHARRLGAGELAVCKAGGRASPSVGSHFHRHGAGRCGSRDPPRTHCMRLPSPTPLLLRGRRRWCLQQQARRMPHPMQSSPSAC